MAVTNQPRTGLPQWSAGTDPFTRGQMDAAFLALEQNVALFGQGVFSARPAAGTSGRFFYATDTASMYYDTGSAWVLALGGGSGGGRVSTLMLMGA